MIITGARGTYSQFGNQLAGEFQGTNNFTYEALAIFVVGAVGYIPAMQTISRWLLAFILLVILLGNKGGNGFFTQFNAALKQGPTQPQGTGTVTGITASQVAAAQAGQSVSGTVPVQGIFGIPGVTSPNTASGWWGFFTNQLGVSPTGQ